MFQLIVTARSTLRQQMTQQPDKGWGHHRTGELRHHRYYRACRGRRADLGAVGIVQQRV